MENYVNNLAVHYLLSRGIKEINVEDPLDITIPKILISIKPNYCELIENGKKTLELRKSKPKSILLLKAISTVQRINATTATKTEKS